MAALGPLCAGLLMSQFWWGSVFLLTLPLAVLALVLAVWLVPAHVNETTERVDHPGGVLSVVFVGALVLGINLVTAPDTAAVALALLGGRRRRLSSSSSSRQRRAPNPLFDLHVAARRVFWVAACAGIIVFGSLMGAVFIGQQFVQNVLGYSSLEAGLAALPAAVFMVLIAPQSAKLVESHGARFTLLLGYLFCLLAFLTMLLLWGESSPVWHVLLGFSFMGIGVSLAGTPASRSLTGSVPVRRAGMASATADLQRDLGGAILQSVFGALLTAGYAVGDGGQHRRPPARRRRSATRRRRSSPSPTPAPRPSPRSTRSTRSRSSRRRGRRSCTATSGPTRPARSPCSPAPASCSSCSRRRTRRSGSSRATTRRTSGDGAPGGRPGRRRPDPSGWRPRRAPPRRPAGTPEHEQGAEEEAHGAHQRPTVGERQVDRRGLVLGITNAPIADAMKAMDPTMLSHATHQAASRGRHRGQPPQREDGEQRSRRGTESSRRSPAATPRRRTCCCRRAMVTAQNVVPLKNSVPGNCAAAPSHSLSCGSQARNLRRPRSSSRLVPAGAMAGDWLWRSCRNEAAVKKIDAMKNVTASGLGPTADA